MCPTGGASTGFEKTSKVNFHSNCALHDPTRERKRSTTEETQYRRAYLRVSPASFLAADVVGFASDDCVSPTHAWYSTSESEMDLHTTRFFPPSAIEQRSLFLAIPQATGQAMLSAQSINTAVWRGSGDTALQNRYQLLLLPLSHDLGRPGRWFVQWGNYALHVLSVTLTLVI